MRMILTGAGLAALIVSAGCSSSSSPATAPPATTAPPASSYAVPGHVPGEVARAVFDGNLKNRGVAGEAIPRAGVRYQATVNCISKPGQHETIGWDVRVALPKTSRSLESGSLPCDGQLNTFDLAHLPAHPIQLALSWKGAPGSRAYGVIEPS